MIKQTAGRENLGEFAPKFAELNDDVLFGEVWSREDRLSTRDRSMVTLCVLMGKGIADSYLRYHLQSAKNNGISGEEMAEIITHAAFYAGWPNAWAAFRIAKEVYAESADTVQKHGGMFGLGTSNTAFASYFTGNSYLKPLTAPGSSAVFLANVTFEPGCRNHWHIHHAERGGGQILICVEGNGRYCEDGKKPQALREGDVVVVPPNVRHWHGAAPDSWFSHIVVEVPGERSATEWCEAVTDSEYRETDS